MMYLTQIGTTPRRRAPLPGGPTMEVLVAAGISDNIATVQVWIPPGGGLPEHDHGPSEIVLVHLSGSIQLQQGEEQHRLEPGAVAHIATGERVSLTNPGTEPRGHDDRRLTPGIRRADRKPAGRVGPFATAPQVSPGATRGPCPDHK